MNNDDFNLTVVNILESLVNAQTQQINLLGEIVKLLKESETKASLKKYGDDYFSCNPHNSCNVTCFGADEIVDNLCEYIEHLHKKYKIN